MAGFITFILSLAFIYFVYYLPGHQREHREREDMYNNLNKKQQDETEKWKR